jgi:hypothetical protein
MFVPIPTREESSEFLRIESLATLCTNDIKSFGYMDGLSQPQIEGLDDQAPHGRKPEGKEPKAVKPG